MQILKRSKKSNQAGFSLVEAIAAIGLLGVVSMGFLTLAGRMWRTVATIEFKTETNSLVQLTTMTMAMRSVCTSNLAPVKVDLSRIDGAHAQINKIYGMKNNLKLDKETIIAGAGLQNGKLVVRDLSVQNFTELCSRTQEYLADFVVTASSVYPVEGPSTVTRKFPLYVQFDRSGNIVGCSSSPAGMSAGDCPASVPTWVNTIAIGESHAATCARVGKTPSAGAGGAICASGEDRPAAGADVDKIAYRFGRWGGGSEFAGTLIVGNFCYGNFQKRDSDATDLTVAYLCE